MEPFVVKWRNFVQCDLCGRFGAYTYPNNKICVECWSTDASKRGYEGSIQSDPKFLGGKLKTTTFAPPTDVHDHIKGYLHIFIDIAIILCLLWVIGSMEARSRDQEATILDQETRITELEEHEELLMDASKLLLEDKVKRDEETKNGRK